VGVSGDRRSVAALPSHHVQQVVATCGEVGEAADCQTPRMALIAAPICAGEERPPLKDQAYLGGWKSPQTLLAVYQRADETTMREGLARRDRRRVQGVR